ALEHAGAAVAEVVEHQVGQARGGQRRAGVRADIAGAASYQNHVASPWKDAATRRARCRRLRRSMSATPCRPGFGHEKRALRPASDAQAVPARYCRSVTPVLACSASKLTPGASSTTLRPSGVTSITARSVMMR